MVQASRWLLLSSSSSSSSSIRLLFSACLFWMSFLRFQSQWNAATSNRHFDMRRSLIAATAEEEEDNNKQDGGGRLLYIVTTMRMYDSGRRETTKGYDRFGQSLIPIIAETTKSLLNKESSSSSSTGLINHVDVYLVAFFQVNETRRLELRRALPNQVGLEIWQDAAPLMYDFQNGKLLNQHGEKSISNHTRGLSRQHRFVIKDKLLHYDYFVCLEDDMILHGAQMQNYIQITNHLYHLRSTSNATTRQWRSRPSVVDPNLDFYGPMTAKMLQRTIPGWFRVEAALPGWKPSTQNLYEQIPIDYDWNIQNNNTATAAAAAATATANNRQILVELNPSYCCHVRNETVNDHVPHRPTIRDLYFWETSIDALGVRKFPTIMDQPSNESSASLSSAAALFFDWALLLVGTTEYAAKEAAIYDYWAGRDPPHPHHGYFFGMHEAGKNIRPPGTKGRYMNNQGGWTATRRQVIEWHSIECARHVGSFLPPFDMPGYQYDGLAAESVEYWSGGQQLASSHGCNLLRIIPLEPSMFERQLLYHSSNNKQRQQNVQHRFSSRNIQEFWGQLNTVRKNAERAILRQQEQQQQVQ